MEKINELRKLSNSYHNSDTSKLCLDKTWNMGMGRQSFIEEVPESNTILYNTLLTNQRDIENIKKIYPTHTLIPVYKPYHSHTSLKTIWEKSKKEKSMNSGTR